MICHGKRVGLVSSGMLISARMNHVLRAVFIAGIVYAIGASGIARADSSSCLSIIHAGRNFTDLLMKLDRFQEPHFLPNPQYLESRLSEIGIEDPEEKAIFSDAIQLREKLTEDASWIQDAIAAEIVLAGYKKKSEAEVLLRGFLHFDFQEKDDFVDGVMENLQITFTRSAHNTDRGSPAWVKNSEIKAESALWQGFGYAVNGPTTDQKEGSRIKWIMKLILYDLLRSPSDTLIDELLGAHKKYTGALFSKKKELPRPIATIEKNAKVATYKDEVLYDYFKKASLTEKGVFLKRHLNELTQNQLLFVVGSELGHYAPYDWVKRFHRESTNRIKKGRLELEIEKSQAEIASLEKQTLLVPKNQIVESQPQLVANLYTEARLALKKEQRWYAFNSSDDVHKKKFNTNLLNSYKAVVQKASKVLSDDDYLKFMSSFRNCIGDVVFNQQTMIVRVILEQPQIKSMTEAKYLELIHDILLSLNYREHTRFYYENRHMPEMISVILASSESRLIMSEEAEHKIKDQLHVFYQDQRRLEKSPESFDEHNKKASFQHLARPLKVQSQSSVEVTRIKLSQEKARLEEFKQQVVELNTEIGYERGLQ